jgi:hypothetical protein
MSVKESEIREGVAKNLNLLDKNLILIKEEYRIKLEDGRTGFIDILAKDKFGCYTIIEIKKSNQTARTAIQQLFKYASFFKKKNRLESSQIRCLVISTVWEELSAPFSEFKHFSEYDVKGYELQYCRGGDPHFNEVFPEFITGNNKPLGNFYFFKYKHKSQRDFNLSLILRLLNKISSINSVTFSLNAIKDKGGALDAYGLDEYPFGIAWVVFTGNADEIERELSDVSYEDNSNIKDIDVQLARWESDEKESAHRSKIVKLYLNESQNLGPFKGYAIHTLNNLFHLCDFDAEPVTKGPMFDDGLYTNGEAIDLACGIKGLHPYIFIASSSPQRSVHFNTTRLQIEKFLRDNLSWRECVNELFSSLTEQDEIEIQIFNPLNVFGFFNDLYVAGTSQRIPHIVARVITKNEEVCEYYGALLWDSVVREIDPANAVKETYPSLNIFKARSVMNTITEYDENLSKMCGLDYGLLDLKNSKSYSLKEQSWVAVDLNDNFSLNDFVQANRELIGLVGVFFKGHEIGIGNRTNVVEINNT